MACDFQTHDHSAIHVSGLYIKKKLYLELNFLLYHSSFSQKRSKKSIIWVNKVLRHSSKFLLRFSKSIKWFHFEIGNNFLEQPQLKVNTAKLHFFDQFCFNYFSFSWCCFLQFKMSLYKYRNSITNKRDAKFVLHLRQIHKLGCSGSNID